jgi:hypothetical protein
MSAASKSGREDAGPARQRFLLTFFAEKKVRRNENRILLSPPQPISRKQR